VNASRKQFGLIAAAICAMLAILPCRSVVAETWGLKPQASRDRRLAPELDLLKRGNCRFKGICRNGKAVFSIPSDKTTAVRTMAINVDANVPEVDPKSRRLMISYADGGTKPLAETLNAAGLRTIEDYERGSFLLVEPEQEVSATTRFCTLRPTISSALLSQGRQTAFRLLQQSPPMTRCLDTCGGCRTSRPLRSGRQSARLPISSLP
jgi:hypothetical protein